MANIDASMVNGSFAGILVGCIAIVFLIYVFFDISENKLVIGVLCWLITSGIAFATKTIIGDEFSIGYVFLFGLISTAVIILPLIGLMYMSPIVVRAFENTIGYWFVNNGRLTEILGKMFSKPRDETLNIIVTQIFGGVDPAKTGDSIKAYLLRFLPTSPDKPFKDFTISSESLITEQLVGDLSNVVKQKSRIAEATLISLGIVMSSLACFLPAMYKLT
jgi:hypothetical protein